MGKRSDLDKIPKVCRPNNYIHGHRYGLLGKPTPEYHCWAGILKRVKNPNDKLYPYYGGRGICVDPKWETFEGFLEDIGTKPEGDLSLDRIDNDKGYYKDNVRWATRTEQSRNRRNNIIVDWTGEETCLAEACEYFGWSYKIVWRWFVKEDRDFEWISSRAKELWGGKKKQFR